MTKRTTCQSAFLATLLAMPSALKGELTLNFFVRDYPQEITVQETPDASAAAVNKRAIINQFRQPAHVGVYAMYNGYVNHSDHDGLISFIRRTLKPEFYLLVTPYIHPIYLMGNTLGSWFIEKPAQARLFLMRLLQDDQTKLHYWKTQQVNLPSNNIMPLHTIVIPAKPNKIYVPLGVQMGRNEANLVLPPVYAKKGLDRLDQTMFVLSIKHFLAPIEELPKISPNTEQRLVTTATS